MMNKRYLRSTQIFDIFESRNRSDEKFFLFELKHQNQSIKQIVSKFISIMKQHYEIYSKCKIIRNQNEFYVQFPLLEICNFQSNYQNNKLKFIKQIIEVTEDIVSLAKRNFTQYFQLHQSLYFYYKKKLILISFPVFSEKSEILQLKSMISEFKTEHISEKMFCKKIQKCRSFNQIYEQLNYFLQIYTCRFKQTFNKSKNQKKKFLTCSSTRGSCHKFSNNLFDLINLSLTKKSQHQQKYKNVSLREQVRKLNEKNKSQVIFQQNKSTLLHQKLLIMKRKSENFHQFQTKIIQRSDSYNQKIQINDDHIRSKNLINEDDKIQNNNIINNTKSFQEKKIKKQSKQVEVQVDNWIENKTKKPNILTLSKQFELRINAVKIEDTQQKEIRYQQKQNKLPKLEQSIIQNKNQIKQNFTKEIKDNKQHNKIYKKKINQHISSQKAEESVQITLLNPNISSQKAQQSIPITLTNPNISNTNIQDYNCEVINKNIEILTKSFNQWNIIGQTVVSATKFCKLNQKQQFWQLSIFFLYKYFYTRRTQLINQLLNKQKATNKKDLKSKFINLNEFLTSVQLANFKKKIQEENMEILGAIKKLLAVVLTKLKKNNFDEFNIENYLNLDFTQNIKLITIKLNVQYAQKLQFKKKTVEINQLLIQIYNSIILIQNQQISVDQHYQGLKEPNIRKYIKSRVDIINNILDTYSNDNKS